MNKIWSKIDRFFKKYFNSPSQLQAILIEEYLEKYWEKYDD